MILNVAFFSIIVTIFLGVWWGKRMKVNKLKTIESDARDRLLMLTAGTDDQPKAIDMFNKYVTMARARAVRVQDESLTVIYARENGTKGRIKFDMDTAFDDVYEGDTGVLVIVDPEMVGKKSFYRFIRDADIPTIKDVIELGTGDDLTDRIYKAAIQRELTG